MKKIKIKNIKKKETLLMPCSKLWGLFRIPEIPFIVDGHRTSPFRRVASSSHTVSSIFVDRRMDGIGLDLNFAKLFSSVSIQVTTLRYPLAHRLSDKYQENIKQNTPAADFLIIKVFDILF